MARLKKAEEKPKDSGSLQISVEDFVRTRNSVSFIYFLRNGDFVATQFRPLTTPRRLSQTTKSPLTLTLSQCLQPLGFSYT